MERAVSAEEPWPAVMDGTPDGAQGIKRIAPVESGRVVHNII